MTKKNINKFEIPKPGIYCYVKHAGYDKVLDVCFGLKKKNGKIMYETRSGLHETIELAKYKDLKKDMYCYPTEHGFAAYHPGYILSCLAKGL